MERGISGRLRSSHAMDSRKALSRDQSCSCHCSEWGFKLGSDPHSRWLRQHNSLGRLSKLGSRREGHAPVPLASLWRAQCYTMDYIFSSTKIGVQGWVRGWTKFRESVRQTSRKRGRHAISVTSRGSFEMGTQNISFSLGGCWWCKVSDENVQENLGSCWRWFCLGDEWEWSGVVVERYGLSWITTRHHEAIPPDK